MAETLINIGKIVRNTTKMNVTNGEMEEIVNLRQEDGRLQPLSANVEIWKSLFEALPEYSFLFLHTGKTYKHVLGIKKDTLSVHYIGDVVDDDIVAPETITNKIETIADPDGIYIDIYEAEQTLAAGTIESGDGIHTIEVGDTTIEVDEDRNATATLLITMRGIDSTALANEINDEELNVRNDIICSAIPLGVKTTKAKPYDVGWDIVGYGTDYVDIEVTIGNYKYNVDKVLPLYVSNRVDGYSVCTVYLEFKYQRTTQYITVDTSAVLTTVQKEQIQVYQIGNLLILNDTERVQYLQWKDGSAYVLVDIDYNGNTWSDTLSPLGGVKVRVKPTCNDLGVPTILLANGDLSENNSNDNWTGAGFSEATAASNGLSVIAQAKKIAKELGYLNGFQVGIVALELYDGSYAYTGAPFIIPQANDDGTRYTTTRGQETTTACKDKTAVQDLLDSAGYGAILTTPFKYKTNPKGMELVRPTVNWKGRQSVNSQYKSVSNFVERFPISLGYNTRAQLKYGNVDIGSDGSTASSSAQYATLDLFGLENKTAIETSEDEDNICAPFAFNLYDYNGDSSWDTTEYASNRAVTTRSCSCIEDVNPVGVSGTAFDGDYREYGADCFNPPNAYSIMGTIKEHRANSALQWHLSSQERPNSKACCWGALMTQGLQIKFDSGADEQLSDIIKNVCLFVSSEIYQTDESQAVAQCVKTYALRLWKSSHKNRQTQHNGYTVYGTPKADSKIKEQLSNVQTLYKVYTSPYKNLKSGEWIDIDLSDNLNILEECETLSVDSSYQRNGIKAECAYLYNGRLHLGNISETSFSGYPISELEIPKQWQLNAFSPYSRCASYADCGDSRGGIFILEQTKIATKTLVNALAGGAKLVATLGSPTTLIDLCDDVIDGSKDFTTAFTDAGSKGGGMAWFKDTSGSVTWVFTITDSNNKTTYPIAYANDGYSVTANGEQYSASRCVLVTGVTLKNGTYETYVDNYYIVSVNANGKATITIDSDVTDGSNIFQVAPNGTFTWDETTYTATESYFIVIEDDNGTTEYKYAKKRTDSSFDSIRSQIEEDEGNAVTLYSESVNPFVSLIASRYQDDDRFTYPICKQWDRDEYTTDNTVYILTTIETQENTYTVGRLTTKGTYYPLNPMLSYPSSQAIKIRIGEVTNISGNLITCEESVFELKPFPAIESGIFVSGDLKPICWWKDVGGETEQATKTNKWSNPLNKQDYYHHTVTYDTTDDDCPFKVENNNITDINDSSVTYRPNVLKVSSTESPFFFPAANTYQIGNGEIKAMCSNTIALSTGQWGDAPLYVFCTDGIYGLFVDDSGAMCYPNSRPISREVINNPLSVTPIDDAIVYSSSRGLFLISGSNNMEISQPCEGRPLQFADKDNDDYLSYMEYFIGKEENTSWLNMPNMPTTEDFKEYIKGAHCGWCYKHAELWVANPDYDYTYIYSQGGWSKVMRNIDYFVNDYPRTYFVGTDENGDKRVWDAEENEQTATNCFFVTRPIVVNGEIAKTFMRAWAYGDFNVEPNEETDQIKKHKATIIIYGSHDGIKFSMIGIGGSQGRTRNIVAKLHRMSMRYIRIAFVGNLKYDSIIDCLGLEATQAWGQESTTKQR